MRKEDIVNRIAEQEKLTKVTARKVVNSFIHVVTEALARGDNVTLPNFGTFSTVERASRKCRNPQTGQAMIIPAHKAAKFKPGKQLSEKVNC